MAVSSGKYWPNAEWHSLQLGGTEEGRANRLATRQLSAAIYNVYQTLMFLTFPSIRSRGPNHLPKWALRINSGSFRNSSLSIVLWGTQISSVALKAGEITEVCWATWWFRNFIGMSKKRETRHKGKRAKTQSSLKSWKRRMLKHTMLCTVCHCNMFLQFYIMKPLILVHKSTKHTYLSFPPVIEGVSWQNKLRLNDWRTKVNTSTLEEEGLIVTVL